MIRKSVFLGAMSCVMAIAGGCVGQPLVIGETVRTVMESQIYDYEAAIHPDPNAVQGGDPYRLDAALNLYRTNVAEPQAIQVPFPIDFAN